MLFYRYVRAPREIKQVQMNPPQHFVFLLLENFSHLAFSCAVEPLRIANLLSGEDLYRWSFASEDGQQAICSNRAVTLVHRGHEPLGRRDRLFVLSGLNVQDHITPATLAFLRRERARGVQIGALCSGAYVLARAGMLDGVKTAIHWEFHDPFMEEFPDVDLRRNVFVTDAPFVTASGGTAAADLMLHLIGQAHGEALATDVADQMVYNAVRDADDTQRASLQTRIGVRNQHLAGAIRRMEDTIEAPISPSEIAADLGISTRQLERLFGRYLNCSPRKYAVDLQLQKARRLLAQTELSVTEIALACGFSSPAHLSRVYRAHFGQSPAGDRNKPRQG